MKKLLTTFLVLFIVIGFCFAGGGSEEKSSATSSTAPVKTDVHIPEGEPPKGTIELVMWDEVASIAHDSLVDAAESFNASQSQYHVEVIYTSNILTKVLTSNVEDRPNIVQATGNTSSTYIVPKIDPRFDDPDIYVPLQVFIDHDNYDVNRIIKNSFSICIRGGE